MSSNNFFDLTSGIDIFTIDTKVPAGFGVRALAGADFIVGSDRPDCVYGNDGADSISSRIGNDSLQGGRGADILSGNAGADFILGERGNDVLYGGRNNDTLIGQEGDDYAPLTSGLAQPIQLPGLNQGKFGNCAFIAALAATFGKIEDPSQAAFKQSVILKNAITSDGNTYTLKFYNYLTGELC
jgi:RTX calcium-binding nonapeptide repeat (4 copies)